MAPTIKHKKTNNVSDWTQDDVNILISQGNLPVGTKLSDITLDSDWNDNHNMSQATATTDGYLSSTDWNTFNNKGGSFSSLFDHYSDSSNTGSGETALYSDSITANTLANNGDRLVIEYDLVLANNSNNKQVRIYFAGNLLFDTGSISTTISNSLIIKGTIVRDSSSTIRYGFACNLTQGLTNLPKTAKLTGLNFATNNTLYISGTGGANNDVTAYFGLITKQGAAPYTGDTSYSSGFSNGYY